MPASNKNKTKSKPPATVQNFPIVGIGASAGGLDAFKRLLAAIPESSGMAYVLVQHLDPSHESLLPEILQRVTKIPVHEITEDIHLAPDHIYVIPSNKMLVSTDGVLKLTDREKKINFSIDVFFTSLADVHKEFAVGVVLSGTGSDGTLGLKAIKEHGGISIAQDSESAAYESMPQSAVNAGVVDFILAPEKIPAQLLQINKAYKTNHFYKNEEELPKDDEDIFKQIIMLLRQRSGVDFTYYKQPTFHRRIARRIALVKKKNLADYLKFLLTDKAEQEALFQDVLIPVTSFFRDPKTFQTLTETVFPILFKDRTAYEPIRVWIAGCSTGEEVFSIAIALHEYITEAGGVSPHSFKEGVGGRFQIFASDISEKAIKKARAAIYTKADVEKLSAIQLQNYFVKNNGGYEVNKFIRDICIFAPHNFLKDPPFAKMDLISCRNVLIYMDTFLQKKAFTTFHYALKENGFLILGKSETPGASSDLFTQISKHDKIYSRKPVPGRFMHVATERREVGLTTKDKTATKYETIHTDFRKSAEAIIISKSPASVVVNEAMDLVHIHGDITPFLQAPPGKPTHNLIKMAREGLAFELRNAIHKAKKEQASVTKENIPINENGKQSLVTIEVIPLADTIDTHYLIQFEKKIIPPEAGEHRSPSGKTTETSRRLSGQNQQLEKELSQTREDMRSITEDMEAANEELQSANEELQSSNEEMQSLNEELETSKEELQSTNEELIIVNQELLDKQEQLNAARNYSDNIITTIREPLIVLDKILRIKTANASFYKKFNTKEDETEGELFFEIQNQQWDDPEIRFMLERLLSKKEQLTEFEINLKFPSIGERTLLLNARQIINEKNSEKLILLAIEDITEQVAAQKIIEKGEERSEKERKLLHDFFTQAPAVLAILKGPEHVFEFANPAYIALIGGRNPTGKTLLEAMPEIKGQGFIELLDTVYNTGESFIGTEMPVLVDKGKGKLENFYLNFTYQAFKNDKGEIEGILVFAYDITEQVNAHKQIEESEKRFSNILTQSLMAIAIFKGPEMVVTFANEVMLNVLGKGDAVLNKPLTEGVPELKDQIFPKLLADVYTTGVPYEAFETKAILVRNGIPVDAYFNFVYQPYRDVDDTITGITVLATETTESVFATRQIQENDAKFRTLAENIPHMIWTATPDGTKNYFNKYFLDYSGKTYEELADDGFRKIIFPADLKEDLQLWHHSLKTGSDFNMEKRIRRHDGTFHWHISHAIAQKDEQGNIIGWMGSNTNIDEQKNYAKELMEAKVFAEMATMIAEIEKSKAELALQSKQQFLSNMSHEIRTPMNAIIGFTKILMKTGLSEQQKEYVQAVKSSGETLIVLINDILDLAKVNAGKMIFVNEPFKISHSITTILQLFEIRIQESNLELIREHDSRIPEIVLGDSVRLHQILINLLSNAIKFTAKGKITVSVNLLNEDEEKVTLEIKVADTGIGIPQNKIATIFENFEQAHTNNSSVYGGTGLGLAIVKQLVEKQGGTISVKSKVDEGSTFSFTLGFGKTNATLVLEDEIGQFKIGIKPLKVLVVEDVKLNQLLMRTILDDFKLAWDIADNGKIAIEKLETNTYDIILMDLQMPIMDGFEATEHIRNKMNLQIPIIALTADVTTVDLEKCKSVGMNDYISKPLDEKLLYNKIMDLIKSK